MDEGAQPIPIQLLDLMEYMSCLHWRTIIWTYVVVLGIAGCQWRKGSTLRCAVEMKNVFGMHSFCEGIGWRYELGIKR